MSFIEPERDDLFDAQTLIDFTELRKAPERLKAAIEAMQAQGNYFVHTAKALELDSLLDAKE